MQEHLLRPASAADLGPAHLPAPVEPDRLERPLQAAARPARHRRGLPAHLELDFFVGLLAKWAVGLQFRWLAKDSLFRGVMGVIMRYWGGVAVDRSAPQGAIRRLAEDMLASKWFWLAITPEGTRGYRPYWKSGFYRIALAARCRCCWCRSTTAGRSSTSPGP
jgi:hypothetical protein